MVIARYYFTPAKLVLLLCIALGLAALPQARAQATYYLDMNGAGPDYYYSLPNESWSFTWSTDTANWNSNGTPNNTDNPVGWVNGNHASFGSFKYYTANISGTVVVADLTTSGPATFTGGTIDFGGNPSNIYLSGTNHAVTFNSTLTSSGRVTIDQGSTISQLYLTGASTFTGGLGAARGTTTYTGTGASLTTNNQTDAMIDVGGTYGSTLTFTAGADLIDVYRVTVGTPSGTGTLNFSGAGTTADITQYIWLGIQSGTSGTMNITDGASVSTGTTVSVGDVAGSSGYLTVSGTGSTLAATGNIYVSYDSYGSATFNAGATVSTGSNFYVASNPTGDADLTIDGTGTTLTIAGDLITATNHGSATTTSASTSNVTVSNHATVTVNGTVLLADLSGAADTMTLNSGGTLIVADDGEQNGLRVGAGSASFNLSGGILMVREGMGSTLTSSMDMALSNASTIDTNGNAASLSGVLSGSGSLTKSGAGTLTLSGANNYSGGTTVSAGTLVGNTTSLQGNITNNAAVVFEQDSVDTYSGTISGSGTLTKSGTGTLYLNAANTYTGATIINAGTLRLGEALPFASTSITVASGASLYVDADSGFTLDSTQTLGGTGTITGGTLTLGSGATLAPGNSPGTLTFTGGLTLDAGAILNFELGTVSDLIAVTGGTLTGPSSGTVTLNLADSGGFTAGTYTLFDYTSATLSDFDTTDFALGTTIAGFNYSLGFNGSTLELTAVSAVPEPSTCAAIFGLGALGFIAWRRRRV